jgi:hypothetical protein
MPEKNAISATAFCSTHHIDFTFIESLEQNGLIQTSIESGNRYIPEEQLPVLEKMIRLHYDMDINFEGIETIDYLLQKITAMQEEMTRLKNRLAAYEALYGG